MWSKINLNGHQCTSLWHVDDIKISHANEQIVSKVLSELEKEYGKQAPLTNTIMGMVLYYTIVATIQVTMFDYIKNMLSELPPMLDGESRTSAPLHLCEVNEEAVKLGKAEALLFHHYFSKLIFLCKRAQPDIQTVVAFLSTRVYIDDYKNWLRP